MPPPSRYPKLAIGDDERAAVTRWLAAAAVDGAPVPPDTRVPSDAPFLPDGAMSPPAPDAPAAWSAVPALAEGHGIAALVAPALAPLCPPAVAAALIDAAGRTLARGRRMAADADRIDAVLGAAGVPFLPIKGMWLAPMLYSPAAARPLADIDLWVPPDALPAATAALAGMGYAEVARTWKHRRLLVAGNEKVVDGRGEHPDNPRPVEIHTRLAESFRGIDLDLTAELDPDRARSGRSNGLLWVHVAAHATVDALNRRLRLIQLIDVGRLGARLEAADWDEVSRVAGTPHAARFVWPAMALAGRVAGGAWPAAVEARLAADVAAPLREWVAGADLDALGYFARDTAPRPLGEVPGMWPRSAAERLAVWRFIVWPGRWALADRYPRLARSRLWPAMVPLHAGYTLRLVAARWRRRERG